MGNLSLKRDSSAAVTLSVHRFQSVAVGIIELGIGAKVIHKRTYTSNNSIAILMVSASYDHIILIDSGKRCDVIVKCKLSIYTV